MSGEPGTEIEGVGVAVDVAWGVGEVMGISTTDGVGVTTGEIFCC